MALLMLGLRIFLPVNNQNLLTRRLHDYATSMASLLAFSACISVGYAVMLANKPEPAANLVGDFGLPTPQQESGLKVNADAEQDSPINFRQAPGMRGEVRNSVGAATLPGVQLSGVASVFSLAQSSQICEGFAEVAMGALLAGTRGEAFAIYEQKSRQLGERALRLPFVREAGAKSMQQINSLFATLIEEQYYISPKNRSIQLGLIAKVERSMALDAMTQICEMKILEIREK